MKDKLIFNGICVNKCPSIKEDVDIDGYAIWVCNDKDNKNKKCIDCPNCKYKKYEKCLNFIDDLYRLKFDTLVSLHEGVYNKYISEQAENFLKEIGEFKEDNR